MTFAPEDEKIALNNNVGAFKSCFYFDEENNLSKFIMQVFKRID